MATKRKPEQDNAPQVGLFDDPLGQPTLFAVPPPTTLTLEDRFGVPPFSVLDGRGGQWKDRKEAWMGLGIRSEEGRDDKLLDYSSLTEASDEPCPTCTGTGTKPGTIKTCQHCAGTGRKFGNHVRMGSTSVFDPVVCELAYRWFCPPGGLVLDPYAGGSVRGLVAAILGRDYFGIDLRPEQIAANYEQASQVLGGWQGEHGSPYWQEGDSRDMAKLFPHAEAADLVFTCPPYYDLEKYSKDPRDLSNAGPYHKFLAAYRDIIGYCCHALKPDRFACFVVGEVRAKDGSYVGLVPDTIRAFQDHGLAYYNEFILVTPLGTAPVRASSVFVGGRKTVKAHQNILVFVKGDAKVAAAAVPLPGANASQEAEAWVDTTELVQE